MLNNVISPQNTRVGSSNQSAVAKQQLANFCKEECSAAKVFGCPWGKLPMPPKHVADEVGPVYLSRIVAPLDCMSYWDIRLTILPENELAGYPIVKCVGP